MPQNTAPAAGAQNPLGTESIPRLIAKFSVPAIISMLVNAVYNLVDQIFIGQGVGMLGIAATNIAFPLTTICTATALLLGTGGAANFNLKLGEGDKAAASDIAGTSISLLGLAGLAIGVAVMVFITPLLNLFGATPAVMPYAYTYTLITAPGIPFLIFASGVSMLIRADGSPTYSMMLMLAGSLFNIIFDPIFLFVFDMGIAGIALATTLSQILSAVMAAAYLLRRFKTVPLARANLRPQAAIAARACALGAASCFNQLAMTVLQVVLNNTLRHYGGLSAYGSDIPLAAVGAISKLNILFLGFSVGIGQGCQPINGYNYGAKKYDRVRETIRIALIASTAISIIAFLAFQLFPAQLMTIFGEDDPVYLQFAVRYLRIFMLMTFANGIQPVASNFFTSIGRAKMGILISLTRQILFLLPLLLILPLIFGIDGVLVAGPIADGVAAILAFFLIFREMRILKQLQAGQEVAVE